MNEPKQDEHFHGHGLIEKETFVCRGVGVLYEEDTLDICYYRTKISEAPVYTLTHLGVYLIGTNLKNFAGVNIQQKTKVLNAHIYVLNTTRVL